MKNKELNILLTRPICDVVLDALNEYLAKQKKDGCSQEEITKTEDVLEMYYVADMIFRGDENE